VGIWWEIFAGKIGRLAGVIAGQWLELFKEWNND